MEISVGNVISIRDWSRDIEEYCRANLLIDNPEYAKKQRMGFWVGKTPKQLRLYQINGDKLIIPFGCLQSVRKFFNGCPIKSEFKAIRELNLENRVSLYDYQEKALDALILNNMGILQAPAGSGKTQIGIALASTLNRKTLWLTHTHDLLSQSYNRAKQYIDESHLGTITEGKVNINDITFATVQTMARLNLNEYIDEWDVIIVDECHRVAGTPTSVTQFYKVINSLRARHKYGLSATIHRADGLIKCCFALLGDVVYSISQSEVEDKVMQVTIQTIETGIQIGDEALNTDGTLNYTKLINYLCENKERNQIILNTIIDNSNHSILVLSDRLMHLETLMKELPPDIKKKARIVNGKMTSKKAKALRESFIDEMRTGEASILFATYSLAKEGLDIPRLDRLIMATPQKDYAIVTQSVGRIARRIEGKEEPICVDLVDDVGYLRRAYKKRCASYNKLNCKYKENK